MTGCCVVCDFDNRVHDLVPSDDSACRSLEVFADCVSAVRYSEGLSLFHVPSSVNGLLFRQGRILRRSSDNILPSTETDFFDVFEPSQSAFDVSRRNSVGTAGFNGLSG